jgi:hypothetical protein
MVGALARPRADDEFDAVSYRAVIGGPLVEIP